MKLPRVHHGAVKTRFPTKFNPTRSAFKQEILLPSGVVYNPAPSAPTPLETPAAFSPKAESENRAFVKDKEPYNVSTMPPLDPVTEKKYHLTNDDALEIRKLRTSEPFKWTRKALAQKYNVSEYVIGLVSSPAEEYEREMQGRLQEIKSQWTDKRIRARDHRMRRKNFWLRDE